MINIGDIFWLKKESDFSHPHVVINIDEQITVVAITTNQKKANLPGNVILDKLEGNLDKNSIVDVSKTYKIQKEELGEYIGTLAEKRVKEIVSGRKFLEKILN